MINDELMKKVSDLMNGSELTFFRGQLRNLVKAEKEGTKEIYYLADIRIPRTLDAQDVYSVGFNVCHVCFSSEFVKANRLTDDIMKTFKDNEVLLNVAINSNVKPYKANDGQTYKANNVKFFVEDIILLNNVQKPSFSGRKVVSL